MPIKVEADRVVKLAYRLTDGEGRLLEERTPEHAYEYLHGRGAIVGPIERAIEGKTAGFRAEVSVTPRDGYGEYDPALVAEIPRDRFPAQIDIQVGMKFNTNGPGGRAVVVRVIEADEATITVDGNHPLAGLDLIFELRVLDVREATEAEIESGRVGQSHAAAGSDSGETLH